MTPEISIVTPAFNEALRLPATLDRVERHLAAISVPGGPSPDSSAQSPRPAGSSPIDPTNPC